LKKDKNPQWDEFTLPLAAVDGRDGPIQITLLDRDYDGTHDLLGHVTTTLGKLLAAVSPTVHSLEDIPSMKETCPSDCMPIVQPNTEAKYDPATGYTHSGCLQILKGNATGPSSKL